MFDSLEQPINGYLQVQYDYLAAYFDFYVGSKEGYKKAKEIVKKYETYPVSTWRMMFCGI